MRRMVLDTSNLLFRVSSAHTRHHAQSGTPEENAGLAMHMALNSLAKLYREYRPVEIAVTFEGRRNWRKDYTRSEACKSGQVYKANRVHEEADPGFLAFVNLISAFEELVKNHSSMVCLSHPRLEGDDLFAGYIQKYTALGDEVIGVSGDKDFVQLWKYPNFQLINPDTGKPRTVESVCETTSDPEYFMFEKAIRGDRGDNVFSAYPRVFKKRLVKAYSDPYEMTNLLNETWTFTDQDTGATKVNKVKDLFDENMLLMGLDQQPEDIKKLIIETVDQAIADKGEWSLLHFSKFCGKYGLVQISQNVTRFVEMFSLTGKEKAPLQNNKKKELLEF